MLVRRERGLGFAAFPTAMGKPSAANHSRIFRVRNMPFTMLSYYRILCVKKMLKNGHLVKAASVQIHQIEE